MSEARLAGPEPMPAVQLELVAELLQVVRSHMRLGRQLSVHLVAVHGWICWHDCSWRLRSCKTVTKVGGAPAATRPRNESGDQAQPKHGGAAA